MPHSGHSRARLSSAGSVRLTRRAKDGHVHVSAAESRCVTGGGIAPFEETLNGRSNVARATGSQKKKKNEGGMGSMQKIARDQAAPRFCVYPTCCDRS